MRYVTRFLILTVCLATFAATAVAQPPKDTQGDAPKSKGDTTNSAFVENFVARMMKFDKNKDGKLTRDEITDERLLRLFDRADANKDGVVTKEELQALAVKLAAEEPAGGRGGPGGGPGAPGGGPGGMRGRGPGGPGGPGGGQGGPGGGPGGPGGGRGRGPGGPDGGPPQPGQIMPGFLQDELHLSDKQKKQLDALQKDVDAKLEKILTEEQKKQLKEMHGGRGGPSGPPGGQGRPGGGPGGPGGREE
jgi:hypothetical protein